MKNFIYFTLITCFLICCNSKENPKFIKLSTTNNELLKKIDSLKIENDSLKKQIKKCDNWVTYLESE